MDRAKALRMTMNAQAGKGKKYHLVMPVDAGGRDFNNSVSGQQGGKSASIFFA